MSRDRKTCRRRFLLGAGTGILATGSLHHAHGTPTAAPLPYARKRFTGKCVEVAQPNFALPGPFPGRVVEIQHPSSINKGVIRPDVVRTMMHRGMMELTGAPNPAS